MNLNFWMVVGVEVGSAALLVLVVWLTYAVRNFGNDNPELIEDDDR